MQRFSPRRRNSVWSELNKERCRRLERLGLMQSAGRAVLPDMSEHGFVIAPDILASFQANPQAWIETAAKRPAKIGVPWHGLIFATFVRRFPRYNPVFACF